ncbi:MAG: hypothetical protein ABIU09_04865 [Pyrinomonadaceae bacterium]
MNSLRHFFSLLTIFPAFFICTAAAFGQADVKLLAEPNYDAILHVVVGTSESGQSVLPAGLSSVSKQLRAEFGVTNLKLLNTYLGRMTTSGTLEYKGVSNAYVQEVDTESPSFLDWRLSGLKSLQNSAGQNVFQFQTFRFGARVPVKVTNYRDETGKSPLSINYEAIGLTLDRMGVVENSATLVGTLSQPKTNGTLFLILTVKNAAR